MNWVFSFCQKSNKIVTYCIQKISDLCRILLGFIAFLMISVSTPVAETSDELVAEVQSKNLIATEYRPFLDAALTAYTDVAGDLTATNYGSKTLKKIIVLDSERFSKLDHLESAQVNYHTLRLNAVAVPSDTILIDSDYLDLIIWSAITRYRASTTQKHGNQEEAKSEPHEAMRHRFIISDMIRGEIIRAYLTHNKELQQRRSFIRDLLRERYSGRSADLDFFGEMIGAALLPLLLHEAAHLDKTIPSHANPIDLYASPMVEAVRKEEDRADNVMIERLTPMVSNLNKTIEDGWLALQSTGTRPPKRFGIAVAASLSLLSYGLLHRDLVLIKTFDRFRGYDYQDYFYNVLYVNCDPEHPTQTEALEFKNVLAAWRDPLPTLTTDEFDELKGEISATAYHTHSHHFRRAAKLIQLLSPLVDGKEEIEQFSSLLDYANEGKGLKLYGVDHLQHMNLTATKLLGGIGNALIENATVCPAAKCYVVYLSADKKQLPRAHLVIWADASDRVLRIKYRTPLFLPANSVNAETNYTLYPEKMIEMASLMLSFVEPNDLTINVLLGGVFFARIMRAKCGVGQTSTSLPDRFIVSRSTLTGDSIEVLVEGTLP